MNPNIQQAIQTMANQLMHQGLNSPALQAQIKQNPALLSQFQKQCMQQARLMVTTRLKQNEWRLSVSAQDRKTIIEHILATLNLVNSTLAEPLAEKTVIERATVIEKSFYDKAASKENYILLAKETLNSIRMEQMEKRADDEESSKELDALLNETLPAVAVVDSSSSAPDTTATQTLSTQLSMTPDQHSNESFSQFTDPSYTVQPFAHPDTAIDQTLHTIHQSTLLTESTKAQLLAMSPTQRQQFLATFAQSQPEGHQFQPSMSQLSMASPQPHHSPASSRKHLSQFPSISSRPSPQLPPKHLSLPQIEQHITQANQLASQYLQRQTALQSQHLSLINFVTLTYAIIIDKVNSVTEALTQDQIQTIQQQRESILSEYKMVQVALKDQDLIIANLTRQQQRIQKNEFAAMMSDDFTVLQGLPRSMSKSPMIPHQSPYSQASQGFVSGSPQFGKSGGEEVNSLGISQVGSLDMQQSQHQQLAVQQQFVLQQQQQLQQQSQLQASHGYTGQQVQAGLAHTSQHANPSASPQLPHLNPINPLSLKPIELSAAQKARVLVTLQEINPYFRFGMNVYNIFMAANNIERAQKFQILLMMYMRQFQAADLGIFYMSPETVEELGAHLKKHTAEAKVLFERNAPSNPSQSLPPTTSPHLQNTLLQPQAAEQPKTLSPHKSPLMLQKIETLIKKPPAAKAELCEEDVFNFDTPRSPKTDSLPFSTASPKKSTAVPVKVVKRISKPNSTDEGPREEGKDDKSDDFNFYFDLESPILKKRGLSQESNGHKRQRSGSPSKALLSHAHSPSLPTTLSHPSSPLNPASTLDFSEFTSQGLTLTHLSTGTHLYYSTWIMHISPLLFPALLQGSDEVYAVLEECLGCGMGWREVVRALMERC